MAFGRMERSRGEPPMSDINMTPLIDVMLVLLVIFIITAPLMAGNVRLRLPQAAAPAGPAAAPALVLTLDAGGQLYLGREVVSDAVLVQRLTDVAARDAQTELRLRADRSVPYGRVVQLMALAQKAGLSRIGFVTDPPAP